jgi:tetratricopeptide (TPR) repeat protein
MERRASVVQEDLRGEEGVPTPPRRVSVSEDHVVPKSDLVSAHVSTLEDLYSSELFKYQPAVLQRRSRLSFSLIWDWLKSYYDLKGPSAWTQSQVPTFLASNSYVAKSYAAVLLSFLRENAHVQNTVLIVEIGAGHGRLSFLILTHLTRMIQSLGIEQNKLAKFKYILTDFTKENVSFCRSNRKLKAFVKQGILDFAVFDVEQDESLSLIESKEVIDYKSGLANQSKNNPIVLISNYVFDSLRQDAFRVVNGELYEGVLTVRSDHSSEPDLQDPNLIKRVRFSWHYNKLSRDDNGKYQYYSGKYADLNPVLNDVVKQEVLANSTLLIPLGAIKCIKAFLRLSGNQLFVLAGDKGYNHAKELIGLREPHIAVHGSFSMMVNFHFVKSYLKSLYGATSMQTTYYDGFKVNAFFVSPNGTLGSDLGRMTFANLLQGFGPEEFAMLQRAIKEDSKNPSLRLIITLLRLSSHDPDVFFKFRENLLEKVCVPKTMMSSKLRQDLVVDLQRVMFNYYPINPNRDIAFEAGRIFLNLEEYKRASLCFRESLFDVGEHPSTYANLALALEKLGDVKTALEVVDQALMLKADFKDAIAAKQRLIQAMERKN